MVDLVGGGGSALAGSRRRPLKYVQVPVELAKRHRPRRCTGRRRRSASRVAGGMARMWKESSATARATTAVRG